MRGSSDGAELVLANWVVFLASLWSNQAPTTVDAWRISQQIDGNCLSLLASQINYMDVKMDLFAIFKNLIEVEESG